MGARVTRSTGCSTSVANANDDRTLGAHHVAPKRVWFACLEGQERTLTQFAEMTESFEVEIARILGVERTEPSSPHVAN
jgi:hypothetical protein